VTSSFYETDPRHEEDDLLRGPEKAQAMARSSTPSRRQRERKAALGLDGQVDDDRKNPAFNETHYGFSTFSKLLRTPPAKIVTPERYEKSGTYVIGPQRRGGRPQDARIGRGRSRGRQGSSPP
jgi:hypothetical protein